jgi:hypothetical protein
MLRSPQVHGNVTRMVRASVLSECNGVLRVIPEGQKNPIDVKASDTVAASAVFGTRLAMQQGVVIQRALPDSPNSLSRICENRGV